MSRAPGAAPATRNAVEAAVGARHSLSKVGPSAPDDAEIERLTRLAATVADHGKLRPWRVITLRGEARERLGAALGAAEGSTRPSSKPLRAPLLIAVVVSPVKSSKAPLWEQEATAAGVAHLLSLLLHEAGWGVIWRTGKLTRTAEVARMHGLAAGEELLGWLYVGDRDPSSTRSKPVPEPHVTHLS